MDVTANIKSGNANLGNAVTGNYFIGNGIYLTGLPKPTEIKNDDNSSNVKVNLDGNITVSILGTSNVVVFDSGNLTLTGNLISTNANLGDRAKANYFIGNGNSLANLTGANVVGAVALATSATSAGTVTASSQPNITSTGTLVSLQTTGTVNANLGNSVTSNYFLGKFAASASNQPNITSLGTLANITVTGVSTLGSTIEILNTKTGATGTVTHDLSTGSAFLHTSPAANFTPNFTNVAVTDNRATTIALLIVQGATAYVPLANIAIDSLSYTVKWQANIKPTGTANGTDVISYTIAKASGTYYIYGTTSYYQ